MDRVFVHGLEVRCVIGVHDWERRMPRRLSLDVELDTDTRAATGDALENAIDYQAVADLIRSVAGGTQARLLETLAESLARALFERFPAAALRLTVRKPGAVAGAQAVGITIERGRADYS